MENLNEPTSTTASTEIDQVVGVKKTIGNGTIPISQSNSKPVEQTIPANPLDNNVELKPTTSSAKPVEPANNTVSGSIVITDSATGEETELALDTKGNAIDTSGNIIYTAEQIATMENDEDNSDESSNLISEVSKLSGIDISDEYTSDAIGISKLVSDIQTSSYNRGLAEARSKFLSDNPEIADMIQYRNIHGSLDNYTKPVDYNQMTVDVNTDVNVLENLIRESLKLSDVDNDTIDSIIELSKGKDTLREDATKHLNKLKAIQTQSETESQKAIADKEAADAKSYTDYYGIKFVDNKIVDANIKDSVYDKIVKRGEVGNMVIPINGLTIEKDGKKQNITRKDIFEYIQKPVAQVGNNYYTQAQLDEAARMNDTNNYILQSMYNLVGDKNALSKSIMDKNEVSSIKKRIKTNVTKPTTPTTNVYLSAEEVSKGGYKVISKRK